MTGAPPGAAWQSQDLAASFLERRQILVPLLDVQEDLIRRLLSRHAQPIGRFLDVGSGDGAVTALVLSSQPHSEAVLVDFSEAMLERASSRLVNSPGRWQAVRGDLSTPAWLEGLPAGRYDAVVSALAIHHLPSQRKPMLFRELFGLLEPGGLFVNMDYVSIDGPLRGLFDEQMLANAVQAEHEHGGRRTEAEVDLNDDDDRPDSVEDQIAWLRDAGFEQAEVHFKWAEAAVFGAIKPSGGEH
jgi:ubiquinone/menaquinone biosynthesis C-methylase UbiE